MKLHDKLFIFNMLLIILCFIHILIILCLIFDLVMGVLKGQAKLYSEVKGQIILKRSMHANIRYRQEKALC